MKRTNWLAAAAGAMAGMWISCSQAEAQNVVWKTNYFRVTGTNFGEIRRSIEKAKPWKENYHGFTEWTVKWRFTLSPGSGTCHTSGFSTTTFITITLPWWTTPAAADARTREHWRSFYTGLLEHELGHAKIALAAAAAVNREYGTVGASSADCQTLRRTINERADAIVEGFRKQEKEYDRRTSNGSRPDGADRDQR